MTMTQQEARAAVWGLVHDSGIEWGAVDERQDGLFAVHRSDGHAKVLFGPEEDGYDWSAWYCEADEHWRQVGRDWTGDDAEMTGVLRYYLGYPQA